MIKKLLIALVAFSFLIGNFAFADDNPPDVRDDGKIDGFVIDPPITLPALKPAAINCGWQDYTCSGPTYYIGIAGDGSSGITDMMVRFSASTPGGYDCYINEVAFCIFDPYGTNTAGVDIKIYREDPFYDDYPDDFGANGGVDHTIPVLLTEIVDGGWTYGSAAAAWAGPYYWLDNQDVFVAVEPAATVDYWGFTLEDMLTGCGGSCTSEYTGRSLSFFTSAGYHSYVLTCGGTEALNWCLVAEICCEEPAYFCPGNQEWPTFQQNYGRTGYSTNTLLDDPADPLTEIQTTFRRLWSYEGAYYLVWGHPIIANEMVYVAFYDGIVALSVYGPDPNVAIWDTYLHPDYAAFMQAPTNNLRSTPTVEGDRIYFGTGKATLKEGFVCADAYTGDTIWVRHNNVGSPLEGGFGGLTGEVQYATSVIVDDLVYFGTSFGMFYALDKFTGTTVWYGTLDQGVWFAPATDGTDIFVGTSDGYIAAMPAVGGTLYKLAGAGDGMGGMSVLYTWNGYDAAYEGFVTAPVYNAEEDAVYVNGNLGTMVNGYYEGLLIKLAAADLTPIWGGWNLTMNPHFVTPNVMPFPWERITCGGSHSLYWFFPTTAANSALRQFTLGGSLAWYGDIPEIYIPAGAGPYWGTQTCSFATTCDPYLFVGSSLGWQWYIMDGLTGIPIITYQFTDDVLATAVAEYADEDYVVTTQFASALKAPWGKVHCFHMGAPRPRLYIPAQVVTLPSVSFLDTYPQSRFVNIIGNTGGATLTYTLEILTAKAGANEGSSFTKLATELKAEMLSQTMSLLDTRSLLPTNEKGSESYNISLAADFVRFPGGVTTTSGTIAQGAMLNQEFVLDPDLMFRGGNPFQVTVDSDDPDYVPEDTSPYPHATPQAEITVIAVKGYDFCDGYIEFGTTGNTAYCTNAGWNSTGGPADAFVVDVLEEFLYHHSFFYGYEDDHIVWQEEAGNGYNHFEPDDLCLQDTVSFMMSNGSGYFSVDADRFQTGFIDSLKDQATGQFDNSNTPGCRMAITEYGGFDDRFANFKYVYVEITNRGNDPLPADLYWGTFTDWDVTANNENIGIGMIVDGASCYRMYESTDPAKQYGMGFVPMEGNLFAGSLDPTVGAYGTYQLANDPVVYDDIIIDSFFNYIDGCAPYTDCYYPGTGVGVNPGQDMSAILVADKKPVAGSKGETIRGGLVMFGFTDATAPADQVQELMCFANKFAGFGRGDVNDDCVVNIVDLCLLNAYVNCGGQEPYPFEYLGDVDGVPGIDNSDVTYLYNYLFMGGDMPIGDYVVR